MDAIRSTRAVLVAAALSLAAGPARAHDPGWTGDVNLLLGGKTLEEDDWGGLRRQREGGLQAAFGGRDWPVLLSVEVLGARSRELADAPFVGLTELTVRTQETNLGVRKFWRPSPRVRPFLGAGFSFIRAETTARSSSGTVSDSGSGGGVWLGGGLLFTLGGAFNVGLEAKASGAEVELGGTEVDAGGGHLGLVIGWHWGG